MSKIANLSSLSFFNSHYGSQNRLIPTLNHKPLISIKPWEAIIASNAKWRFWRHNSISITAQYSQIPFVYCASSLFAINFILNGVPVLLGRSHPYYGILGSYVYPLNKAESIDAIMSCMLKTSFSVENINKMSKMLPSKYF